MMNATRGVITACLVATAAVSWVGAQDVVFHEQNGLVVAECESVPPGTDWEFLSGSQTIGSSTRTVSGHTGAGCYRFTGNSETSGPVTGPMTYKISITNPGTYRLYLRGMEAPIESGAGDQANDCYIRMVGQDGCEGTFTKFVRLGGSYEWTFGIRLECSSHSFSDPYYDLSAGVHDFQIAGRSKNFLVDRFVLKNSALSSANPESLSLPESPKDGDTTTHGPAGCTLNAVDFTSRGDFYVDGDWLAISPASYSTATATTTYDCESGTYDVTFYGVGESDGQSEYELFINNASVGKYQVPLSSQSFEEGDAYNHTWTDVSVSNGDEIKVQAWTNSADGQEYSRGRWLKVVFGDGTGGTVADPTVMVSPAAGTVIAMGSSITLTGTGENLSWSYDANSDGLGEVPIGTGESVDFDVPTGITGPQEITIKVSGSNGTVERTFNLTAAVATSPRMSATNATAGARGIVDLYSVDGRRLGRFDTAARAMVSGARVIPGTYLVRTQAGMRSLMIAGE